MGWFNIFSELVSVLADMFSIICSLFKAKGYFGNKRTHAHNKGSERAQYLRDKGLAYAASRVEVADKRREIELCAKQEYKVYIHNSIIFAVVFLFIMFIGMIACNVGIASDDKLPINIGLAVIVASALLLASFIPLILTGSYSHRSFGYKIKRWFEIRKNIEFKKYCININDINTFVEKKSEYIILNADPEDLDNLLHKKEDIADLINIPTDRPGPNRGAENVLAGMDMNVLKGATVLVCSWDGLNGVRLMIAMRRCGIDAYDVGAVSDGYTLYRRMAYALRIAHEDHLSNARPITKEELYSKSNFK